MALKPCIACGRPSQGSRCPAHARHGSTRSWRTIRAQILALHAYRCKMCGERATEVDHIVPVADGGTNHASNLRPLCHACHAAR